MRRSGVAVAIASALLAIGCGEDAEPVAVSDSDPVPAPPAPTEWQAVSVEDARGRMDALGTDTLTIIDKRAVGAAVYRLAEGQDGEPFLMAQNVTYHVVEGEALLVAGADTASLAPGSTAFVRGREERAFVDVSSDLFLVGLYTNARPGFDDPTLVAFTREELLETKNPNRNILHTAIEAESMTVGAFMLPREIGGDLLARHAVDELKYVIRGGGTIEAGPDVIPIEAGFVVFVDGSLTHRFTRLWRDLDVLYVWGR